MDPRAFVMHRIFDAVPLLFTEPQKWTEWKIRLADQLEVDAHSVVVIGSGCVGYSLNPGKAFKAYDKESDVDVAVVSGYHFEVAWRFLRNVKTQLYSLPRPAQNSIKQHRDEFVFLGTIATDKILPYIDPFGPSWVKSLAAIGKDPPVSGRTLNIRLYRDSYSLVGYHVSGVKKVQGQLLST